MQFLTTMQSHHILLLGIFPSLRASYSRNLATPPKQDIYINGIEASDDADGGQAARMAATIVNMKNSNEVNTGNII